MPTAILRKVLPKGLKAAVKETIRRELEASLAALRQEVRDELVSIRGDVGVPIGSAGPGALMISDAMQQAVQRGLRNHGYVEAIWPNQPGSPCYLIPKTPERTPENCLFHESSPLPIPPREFWLGYGETVEGFLALGKEHMDTIRAMLTEAGTPIESAGRILDFGCAAGRMIRWLHDLADSCEIWGTDIGSQFITWCKQYLSPPFHFATTTTSPHLPFEDRYFGLIYAGSVFTHLDDLAEAWFLELRRILRPGGSLYITVHDQATIAQAAKWPEENWLRGRLYSHPEYEQYARSDFGMFTLGRWLDSQVFYDVDYLSRKLEPFFKTVRVSVGAYCHQTGILLERL
jgi:SAM-dependent methyltransferase